MAPASFYMGAAALVVLALVLIKKTSPYSRVGGRAYERKKFRRMLGLIFFIMAVLALGVGAMVQMMQGHP